MDSLLLIVTIGMVFFCSTLMIGNVVAIQDVDELPSYKTSVVGNFNGHFDNKMINTSGNFNINNKVKTFVLVGTFANAEQQHWNPITGKYVKSSPNCQKIIGDLVLQTADAKINLDFIGKKCVYGLFSYVIGTFEVTDSTGYEIESGEGRITFVTDHHSNIAKGQLKGYVRG